MEGESCEGDDQSTFERHRSEKGRKEAKKTYVDVVKVDGRRDPMAPSHPKHPTLSQLGPNETAERKAGRKSGQGRTPSHGWPTPGP
jgi:hypothetical protein